MTRLPIHDLPTCVLADDHSVVRDGLRSRLEGNAKVTIVGEGNTGCEALRLIRDLRPDLAIVDVRMPDGDGFEVASTVTGEDLPTRVILYTVLSEPQLIARAFACGAMGFISKDADAEVVFRAVREVMSGRPFVDPAIAVDDGAGERLSAREIEILALLAQGHSNAAIARRLVVTQETVKSHVSNVLTKLRCETRTQAVAIGIRRGLID